MNHQVHTFPGDTDFELASKLDVLLQSL